MRILWSSNSPWTSSGYGIQTKLIVPRLADRHPVALFCWYGLEGGIIHWNSIPCYPKAGHLYGVDILPLHAAHFKADIVITLIDAWVQEPQTWPPSLRWVPYFPIDHQPIPPLVRQKVDRAFARIVFSRYAQEEMEKAGLDCFYAPHAVDASVYRPIDREEARTRTGLPKDKFLVGMVAANKGFPSRKSLPECMQAFALLHARHPDTFLYLHTTQGLNGQYQGVNLPEMAAALGIEDSVGYVDPYSNHLGVPEEMMRYIYNSFDVLLNPSMGEGFGVPILEAQACGVPVIVGDWTSMPELLFAGWKIEKGEAAKTYTLMASYMYTPSPHAIADRLEAAYNLSSGEREKMRAEARRRAMEYDINRVMLEYWYPTLDRIQERIETTQKMNALLQRAWTPEEGFVGEDGVGFHPDALLEQEEVPLPQGP